MKHFKILRFNPSQVKWYMISTTKCIVYDLPHELPSDFYWKNLKHGWRQSLAPSLPSRNKTLALVLVVKNYVKTDIKVQNFLVLSNFA